MEKESKSLTIFDTNRRVNGYCQYNVLQRETNQIIGCIYFSLNRKCFVYFSFSLNETEISGEELIFIGTTVLSLPLTNDSDKEQNSG
ncbi:MAG: hypothetical protein WCY49_06185 [Anaerovoracaceae bacterium]